MIKYILVAYDGSAAAEKAFEFALDLAVKYQAKLSVIAVARPPELAEDVETEAILENAREHFEKIFKNLTSKAQEQNITPVFKISVGHPAEQIIYYAEEQNIDHIVMGHRGKAIFHRWLVGSVAKQVMIYAPCPITIVR